MPSRAEGRLQGFEKVRELAAITNAIEGSEALRWPDGMEPGGKG